MHIEGEERQVSFGDFSLKWQHEENVTCKKILVISRRNLANPFPVISRLFIIERPTSFFGHTMRRQVLENIMTTRKIKCRRGRGTPRDMMLCEMITWRNIIDIIDPEYQRQRSVENHKLLRHLQANMTMSLLLRSTLHVFVQLCQVFIYVLLKFITILLSVIVVLFLTTFISPRHAGDG